jgi:hypothetical protein
MIVPWPFVVALAGPASVGLMYCVAIKVSGRSIATRLLAFEVAALAFPVFGWLFLAVAVGVGSH